MWTFSQNVKLEGLQEHRGQSYFVSLHLLESIICIEFYESDQENQSKRKKNKTNDSGNENN